MLRTARAPGTLTFPRSCACRPYLGQRFANSDRRLATSAWPYQRYLGIHKLEVAALDAEVGTKKCPPDCGHRALVARGDNGHMVEHKTWDQGHYVVIPSRHVLAHTSAARVSPRYAKVSPRWAARVSPRWCTYSQHVGVPPQAKPGDTESTLRHVGNAARVGSLRAVSHCDRTEVHLLCRR